MKKNCWEIKKCGRESGGKNVDEFGVCPAAIIEEYDGVNNGVNGGRFCWAVSGTICRMDIQSTFANKLMDCLNCDFFISVQHEEDRRFVITPLKI